MATKKLLTMIMLILSTYCYSQTQIPPGSVAGTWSDPYYQVNGDIYISAGNSLTIAANTRVEFTGSYIFSIYGTISAGGSSGNEILFTTSNQAGWKGIEIPNNANPNVFEYCIVESVSKSGSPCTASNGSGAVYLYNSSGTSFSNCTLRNNDVCYSGGGIALYSSAVNIQDCYFYDNSASQDGGGLFIDQNSSPNLATLTFQENDANNGGGIYSDNSNLAISGHTFTGNTSINGGGFYSKQSGVALTQNIFNNNYAEHGGAIYCYNNSSPQISANTFSLNSAIEGGAIYCEAASPTINNVISGNSATRGGALFISGNSNPVIAPNISIDNNSATDGGGIYCFNSSPMLDVLIVTLNQASNRGGGIFCENASPNITNSQISENTASYGAGIYLNNGSDAFISQNNINNLNMATNDGGGIYCINSDPEITENHIENNQANNGGGLYISTSNPVIHNNQSISFNTALNNGGGVYLNNCGGTFEEPNVSLNHANKDGGGIYLSEGTLQISNTSIMQNTADNDGGGVYLNSVPAYPVGLSQNNITYNQADADISGVGKGGGLYIYGGSPFISANAVEHNSANDGGGIAIGNSSSTVIMSNTVDYNHAENNGGGIYCVSSTPEIKYNGYSGGSIAYNTSDNDGGGVYLLNSDPIFTGNHLNENVADYDNNNAGNGGGVYYEWAAVHLAAFNPISLNEFRTNEAYDGGGVYLKQEPSKAPFIYKFLNNLVVENTANGDGGGVYLYNLYEYTYPPYENPEINSNTIAYNTATGDGGGLSIYPTNPTPPLTWFNNDLIYNNSPNSGDNTLSTYNSTDDYLFFNYCDIQTSNNGVNLTNNCFDSIPVFHGLSNYHLHWIPRSPSLDQGNANLVRTSIDLDNNNRVLFTNIDLGCYEHDHVNFLIFLNDQSTQKENPDDFSIVSYPNPVREQMTIQINLDNSEKVSLAIYDMQGQLVWSRDEYLLIGSHAIKWERNNNARGLYLLRINCWNKNYDTKFLVE